ncbi:MAG: DNA gyrase C-terminal beta-propeller domain-containing protein, partial [Pseudomonadota bacterium]
IMASDAGYGFIVQESELESNRKAGKSVVSVPQGSKLLVTDVARGDHVAVIGTNRKLLIFPLEELPEMSRGKGNKLQNYRGPDKLADVIIFDQQDGLVVTDSAGRMRSFSEWSDWLGKRAQAGKTVMKGFPKSGRFNG